MPQPVQICFHGIERRGNQDRLRIITVNAVNGQTPIKIDAGTAFYVQKVTVSGLLALVQAGFGGGTPPNPTVDILDSAGMSFFRDPVPMQHVAGSVEMGGIPYILPIEMEWKGGQQDILVKIAGMPAGTGPM